MKAIRIIMSIMFLSNCIGQEYTEIEYKNTIEVIEKGQGNAFGIPTYFKLQLDETKSVFSQIEKINNAQSEGDYFFHSHNGVIANFPSDSSYYEKKQWLVLNFESRMPCPNTSGPFIKTPYG